MTTRGADGVLREEAFDTLVVAAGRRPNLGGLGLEHAGVRLHDGGPAGGVRVNRHTLQWGDAPVFVAGDATNDRPLLHEAADEGRIAGDNAARSRRRPGRAPHAARRRLLGPPAGDRRRDLRRGHGLGWGWRSARSRSTTRAAAA